MSKRDVELVIRARNEATKAIDSVASALKGLAGVQDDVGKSAQRTDGLLGRLAQELKSLQSQAQGLDAMGKVAGQLDRAGAAIKRLEADLGRTVTDLARLKSEAQGAADATARLTQQTQAASSAYEAQKRITAAARAEQTAINAEVRKAEAAFARLARQVVAAKQPNADIKASYEAQAAALAELKVRQEQVRSAFEQQQAALAKARSAQRDLGNQVRVSADNERRLRDAAERTAAAVTRQSEALNKAQGQVQTIAGGAGQLSAALGGVAVKQDSIAEASRRAAEGLVRVGEAIARQKAIVRPEGGDAGSAAQTVAVYRQQVQAVQAAKQAWKEAQAQASDLARQVKATAQPTQELQAAFLAAQRASQSAKTEYLLQAQALNQLRGITQGTFLQFSQAASRMQQTASAQAQTAQGAATLGQAIRNLVRELLGLGNASDTAKGKVNGLRGVFSSFYGESRQAMSLLQRMRGQVLSLAAAYVGLHASIHQIGAVVSSFRSLEAAQNRLGAVFDQDASRIRQELSFLERQAGRLGISFGILSDEYSKFVVAAKAANFSSDATRKVFLSVAEAGRVNKLSVEQMRGVFLALTQMISKGKVMSEELRRQMGDRLPGAFNIMADALGVTTAELDKMLQSGEVLATQDTLLKFADQLDKRFGSQLATSLRTVTTEIGRFQNEIFQAQLRVAQGGFIEALHRALERLNAFFRSREGHDFFLSLGSTLGKFVDLLARVPEHFGLIGLAIKVFIGFKLAQVIQGIIGHLIQLNATAVSTRAAFFTWAGTMAALNGTVGAFRGVIAAAAASFAGLSASTVIATARLATLAVLATGALRAAFVGLVGSVRLLVLTLGGLPGILITGLTIIAGSILTDWLSAVDDTTQAVDEHRRVVGEVVAAYENARNKAGEWQREVKNVSLIDAENNFRKQVQVADEALDKLLNRAKVANDSLYRLFSNEQQTRVRNLARAFENSQISAGDLRRQLEKLNAELDDAKAKELAADLYEQAKAADEAQQRVGEAAVVAEQLGSKLPGVAKAAKDSAKNLDDLAGAAKTVGPALDTAAVSGDDFHKALQKINDMVPVLTESMKRLKEEMKLDEAVKAAMAAAGNWKDSIVAFGAGLKVRAALNDQNLRTDLRTGNKTIDLIVHLESGGRANAQNPLSSAGGLGQFVDSTWLQFFKVTFPDLARTLSEQQILALKMQGEYAVKVLETFTQHNMVELAKAGIPPTDEWIYTAHHFGLEGAKKFADALANGEGGKSLEDLFGPKATRANPWMQGKTVAQGWNWINNFVEQGKVAIGQGTVMQQQAEKLRLDQEKFNAEIQKKIANNNFEIGQLAQTARQQAINKALQDAENAAKEKGLKLSDEQRQKIIESTGALWDQQNKQKLASQEREQMEKRVNDLYQLRKELMDQITFAQANGDVAKADQLRQQLTQTNTQLQDAIQKAVAFWSKMGGPEADLAIAKLGSMNNSIQTVKNSLISASEINNNLISGLSTMFDSMASSLGDAISGAKSWKDALKGIRDAFLQFAADFLKQMAQMIIKQALLNALTGGQQNSSGGVGGFLSGIFGSLFHRGGVVGSGGGRRRLVSPAWFANARRMHQGGIPGLKPSEVPAILKRREEVLAENDPRNVLNGGAGAGNPTVPVKIVNAIDAGSFISEGLSSVLGEKAILNFIRANKSAVKAAMG